MNPTLASALIGAMGAYLALGLVFALWFVTKGVGRLDPVAADGTWGFRLLILPGTAALWPLFVLRLVRGTKTPPDERNAHRAAAEVRS